MAQEPKVVDLYEFLLEAELQHYFNSIKNDLKVTNVSHLKYASDEDLKQLGLSRPEIRRLRKFYEKYYPNGYLSKIKRLLQNPRRDEICSSNSNITTDLITSPSSPGRIPNNKHIIPADSICVNKQLGVGEFGIVQQGVWTNGTERIQVAIKCLCRERMQSNPMEFLKEAAIMHSIEHENIVRLYGVVLDTDSLMLVTELAPLRSLLECLKDLSLRINFLTVPTLCDFAMQICNGMMYLENKRLIHRDLAARNILVFSKNKIKISDFGLSRALGAGKDYYTTSFSATLKLPIAWCAPECINFLRFTNSSDVWAFGVCLWEIFSYGFQPWAALTGQQILEAIDHPNYQRLEQPDCCPKEYYMLMLKCWQHNPEKRPKFNEIYINLPDMKPEQLKTVVSCNDAKKDNLIYRQGDIVTVLERSSNSPYWKGVLNSGKTGLFNPANTVAHLDSLPSSNNRDSFIRTTNDRQSKRKLRTEMISGPQNDLKHTGHVGLDGAYFGDVASFLHGNTYNHLPRQIVTPYKPSEDLEQTPLLLPPTPTSPDSIQTASGYFSESTNPSFIHSSETKPQDFSAFNFPNAPSTGSNPFVTDNISFQNDQQFLSGKQFCTTLEFQKDLKKKWSADSSDGPHEYHEISDDEMPGDKAFDLGPSLLDEMDYMFRSMTAASIDQPPPLSPDFDHTNKRNEMAELNSILQRKNSSGNTSGSSGKSKKKVTTVKMISVKDEKILNQALEFANEISTRSMTDLVSTESGSVAQSPKRKFSFRFPHLTNNHTLGDKDLNSSIGNGSSSNSNTLTHTKERKNFSEELRNAPDLQHTITEDHRLAYNSLVEKQSSKKIDLMKLNDKKHTQHTTLPRNGSACSNSKRPRDNNFAVPTHTAPRPSTLPHKYSSKMTQQELSESSPLRVLRDKNYPIVRPRLKTIPISADENMNPGGADGICESPSYLSNPEYSYSEKDINMSSEMAGGGGESGNPLPLPPRDKNKQLVLNPKRHVRKHPLIIPGAGLVQRTLNKVVQDEQQQYSIDFDKKLNNNYNIDSTIKRSVETSKLKDLEQTGNYQKKFMENNFPDNRTYENIEVLQKQMQETLDSASLNFEEILENDINKDGDMSSPDVVDGFICFDIQKDHFDKKDEIMTNCNDESRNLDIERKKLEFSQRHPKYVQPRNELANNVLFNKIKETVESTSSSKPEMTNSSSDEEIDEDEEDEEELMKKMLMKSNEVSCEDLLELSNENRSGRERGADSDEVRIMSKVLGRDVEKDQCLIALDFINWDVHKAIKICKLRNLFNLSELSMEECVEGLMSYSWDLQTTALKLRKSKC